MVVVQQDVQWGYFVDDNQEPYFGSPLLFYPIRLSNDIKYKNKRYRNK